MGERGPVASPGTKRGVTVRALAKVPKPPGWLGRVGKATWKRVCPIMMDSGVLSEGDLESLGAFCQAYQQMVEYQGIVDRDGPVIGDAMKMQAHPLLPALKAARSDVLRLSAAFGLSPASRGRIVVTESTEGDELDEFLGGGR